MDFTPEQRATMGRAATQELLNGLDRGTLPEGLAVDMVLLHGADVHETLSDKGWTALHLAAALGMVRLVGTLIDAGADVGALSPGHTTPLGVVALTVLEKKELTPAARMIVRRLIAAGASWREIPRVARRTALGREVHWLSTMPSSGDARPAR